MLWYTVIYPKTLFLRVGERQAGQDSATRGGHATISCEAAVWDKKYLQHDATSTRHDVGLCRGWDPSD